MPTACKEAHELTSTTQCYTLVPRSTSGLTETHTQGTKFGKFLKVDQFREKKGHLLWFSLRGGLDDKKPAGGLSQKGKAVVDNTSLDNMEGVLLASADRIPLLPWLCFQELLPRINWKWRVTESDGLDHQ